MVSCACKRELERQKSEQAKMSGKESEEKQVSEELVYVIQKHEATRLHYDLRLEKDGVLKSWAIPKTPPVEAGVKRLAVEVEDHPLEYAGFEGTIPEGQYGAGVVEIWDKGSYKLLEMDANKIIVELYGKKLNGIYCLIRFKSEKNWLFFKKKQSRL